MRRAKACAACRQRRRRCEVRTQGFPCVYCFDRGLSCTISDTPTKSDSQLEHHYTPESIDTASTAGCGLIQKGNGFSTPQSLCSELTQLYFDYVHDQLHTLFHQPSFMKDLSEGKVTPILIYGIMALSARFSTNSVFSGTDPRQRGKNYAKECERLLDWHDVSLTTLHACVLLGAIAITDGNPALENIYYTVAGRIAQLLDLPNRPTKSLVEQEINIRTWWTLCMIDVWSSSGVRLPRLLTPTSDVPLPMDEVTFLNISPDQGFPCPIGDPKRSSLLAEMVRLNHILFQINQYNIRASERNLDVQSSLEDVEDLSAQLDAWLEQLPDHMRDTRENLVCYAEQGLGRPFVALYLGYYNYGQMLFYRFLHESLRRSTTRALYYAQKCKEHASNLCEIVYSSSEAPGCDVKYNMVAHVLVIASTIQIHTLLFDGLDANLRVAKSRLEKNFSILTGLVRLWPTLDVCMDRLMAFHTACRESADTSFCMDQWMVRFLVEFANPVDDKRSRPVGEDQWSLAELGIP
ncbi:fungal-specific transcription factor domain-containing protein [Aspergillus parasiticus]|uniref:Fungal-specific transcription factor domain-containing protein n=1 Tax=Aspergillus parasiticus TaxID=5067 RepID=A0A5N6DKQ4_ASPPA|nr:fungal-specific transcription factor domain-containing protein [Aspergillus parasiticus]